MSARDDWRRVRAIVRKDLLIEFRSKSAFNSVASLGVTILVLLGLSLGPEAQSLSSVPVAAIWIATLFAGVLAFNRSFQVELDSRALEPLLLYPGARWTILAGKLISNLLFTVIMVAIIVAVGMVLFSVEVKPTWPTLVLVLFLGIVGLVALGTFYASMTSRSRAREVLLPLLLFPMLVPVLIAATTASTALMGSDVMHEAGSWVRLLVAYDAIFLVATLLAFEHVIEA